MSRSKNDRLAFQRRTWSVVEDTLGRWLGMAVLFSLESTFINYAIKKDRKSIMKIISKRKSIISRYYRRKIHARFRRCRHSRFKFSQIFTIYQYKMNCIMKIYIEHYGGISLRKCCRYLPSTSSRAYKYVASCSKSMNLSGLFTSDSINNFIFFSRNNSI